MYRHENGFDFSELEWRKIIPNLIIVVIGVGIFLYIRFVPAAETPPEIPSRSIEANTMGVTEIWRESFSRLGRSDGHQFANKVLTSDRIITQYDYNMVSILTSTGALEWKTVLEKPAGSIAADQHKAYVSSAGVPLRAYDLETGKLVWSGPILPPRMLHFLTIQNGLLVDYSNLVRYFDPETGDLLYEIRKGKSPSDTYHITQIDKFDLRNTSKNPTSNELFKIRRETEEIVWRTPLEITSGLARIFPLLSKNNTLIAMFGRREMDLYAIDFETGQRLWKADGFYVSNAVISQNKVYVLRNDARLMVFDELTGTELGYVQFTPTKTNLSNWVCVDDQGRIFVYFSDSEVLIGLEPN